MSDPSRVADPDSTVSRADPVGVGAEAQDALTGEVGVVGGDKPKLDPLTRGEAQMAQFPSLHGQAGVEIAERSADVSKIATKRHRKIFRVFTAGIDFVAEDFDHLPNLTATRQYMIEHGLRPLGDVSFVGAEAYDDKNTDLVYEVEAVPAAIATDPATANVVVSQD